MPAARRIAKPRTDRLTRSIVTMSGVDGLELVSLEAMGWGALIGTGVGLAGLVYLLTAQPGGWTEFVKAMTMSIHFPAVALPYGWVAAWLVDIPYPWLVGAGGAAWFVVAFWLADDFLPERMVPWSHCAVCSLGYGLVAGLAQGGESAAESWPAATGRVAGGIVVLGALTGLTGWALQRPLERLVVTRDLQRLDLPLLVPRVPGHELGAGAVDLVATQLRLHYSSPSEHSKVRVEVQPVPDPFPPTEGPWVDVYGADYWAPDGDDRWIHHDDYLVPYLNRDGSRDRRTGTRLAVRHYGALVTFTLEPRTVPDQSLHDAADSIQPQQPEALARLVDLWF